MSMGYSNRVWRCPFFRWDKREEIRCEGGHIRRFQHQRELAAWARNYCGRETGWEACPTARALLCPKEGDDEKGAHPMERNVDKIKRLERELGRWQKKVADQQKEMERLRKVEAVAQAAISDFSRQMDGALGAAAMRYGEQALDPDTGALLGWRMPLPAFSLEEQRYEVRTLRTEGGGYLVIVVDQTAGQEPETP